MRDLSDVTVGFKTFYRTEKLETALKSLVGLGIKEVIVADDGPEDNKKEEIYKKMKEYLPLKILKLPYDAGLGYGRKEIVKKCKTKYLLIIDDDMEVPNNVHLLKRILENEKDLGGIAGCWSEYGKLKCGAHNLGYKQGYVIRYVPERVEINVIDDIPYVYFDFIPNSALFRMKALKDYCWDENYVINFEHIDFYWGHKQLRKWRFAVTPAVFFKHYPGGNKTYRRFRLSRERSKRSKEYFLKKWNLKGVINLQMGFIHQTYSPKSVLWFWLKKHAPFRVLPYLMKIEET
ncbi:MAG: glycosyltransferase family 2 protein [Candidatus Njordarchaeia archaeon]